MTGDMAYINLVSYQKNSALSKKESIKVGMLDLDGTLFDNNHRLHLLQEKDFNAYQAACVEDTLRMDIVKAILAKNYDAYAITSGRSMQYVMHTINALPNEIASKVFSIYLRADGNYASNVQIKMDALSHMAYAFRCHDFWKEVHIEWWDDNPKCFEGLVKGQYIKGEYYRDGDERFYCKTFLDDFFLVEPVTNANTLS